MTSLGRSPSDLIIEIDITSPSLNKFPVCADIGVLEVWRYDGTRVTLFILAGEDYETPRAGRFQC